MHADELAHATGRGGSGIGRGLHRAHVSANDGRHQAGVNLLPSDEDDIGGLAHRVGGFDHADEPACLDHPECITVRVRSHTDSRFGAQVRRFSRRTVPFAPGTSLRDLAPRGNGKPRHDVIAVDEDDLVHHVGDDAGMVGEDEDAIPRLEGR